MWKFWIYFITKHGNILFSVFVQSDRRRNINQHLMTEFLFLLNTNMWIFYQIISEPLWRTGSQNTKRFNLLSKTLQTDWLMDWSRLISDKNQWKLSCYWTRRRTWINAEKQTITLRKQLKLQQCILVNVVPPTVEPAASRTSSTCSDTCAC